MSEFFASVLTLLGSIMPQSTVDMDSFSSFMYIEQSAKQEIFVAEANEDISEINVEKYNRQVRLFNSLDDYIPYRDTSDFTERKSIIRIDVSGVSP